MDIIGAKPLQRGSYFTNSTLQVIVSIPCTKLIMPYEKVKGRDDVWTLGYDAFILPLVKAVQQCRLRMDELEKRIADLEKQYSAGYARAVT